MPLIRDRIRDSACLPVDRLQLLGACARRCRKRAAVGAEDRRHVVPRHQRVDGGRGRLRGGRVDDFQPNLSAGEAKRGLHTRELGATALRLRTGKRIDRAENDLVLGG